MVVVGEVKNGSRPLPTKCDQVFEIIPSLFVKRLTEKKRTLSELMVSWLFLFSSLSFTVGLVDAICRPNFFLQTTSQVLNLESFMGLPDPKDGKHQKLSLESPRDM